MALPPIISNLPIIKLFKPQGTAGAGKAEAHKSEAAATADSVKLSAAAVRHLKMAGVPEIKDPVQARGVAADTRAMLGEYDGALGLDPKFG